jgi:hypothetical protein
LDISKKLFACINIPYFDFKTFKNYEEVGLAAEEVAKTSCIDATALERELTLEQAESITKLLCWTAFLFYILLISRLLFL